MADNIVTIKPIQGMFEVSVETESPLRPVFFDKDNNFVTSDQGDYDSIITELRDSLTVAKADITGLQVTITANSSALSSLTSTVGEIDGIVYSLSQQQTALTSDINLLRLDVDGMQTEIDSHSSAIDTLTTYVQTNGQEMDLVAQKITQLENTVETQQTTLDGAITQLSNNTTAIESLTTQVNTNGQDITSLSQSITNLSNDLTVVQTDVNGLQTTQNAHSGILDSLDSRITLIDGELTAETQSRLLLESRVDLTEAMIKSEIITSSNKNNAFTAAINILSSRMIDAEETVEAAANIAQGMNTRVDILEGSVSSHSQQFLTVESSISALSRTYIQPDEPTGQIPLNSLWIDTDAANATFTYNGSSWVATDLGGNSIFVQPDPPTAPIAKNSIWFDSDDNNKQYVWDGDSWEFVGDPRTAANTTAIQSLNSLTTQQGNTITTQGQSINSLQSAINNPTTGLNALSTAYNNMNTVVNQHGQSITANADLIQGVSTTVNGHTSTIQSHAQSINGLEGRWGVTIDVNGLASGFSSVNNGTTSEFAIAAHKFKIVSPSGGSRTEYSDGNWRVYDANGTLRVRMGVW